MMPGGSVTREDIQHEDIVDAVELVSTGSSVIFSGAIVISTSASTKTVTLSGINIFHDPEILENGDFIALSGTSGADGLYSVDQVTSSASFTVNESIVDSSGGLCNAFDPPGAARVGIDSASIENSESSTVQGVIEDLDGAISAVGACRVCFQVDAGIRGGGTEASSNNDVAAIRFDNSENGWNRINLRPPQNYVSGNLTMRLWFTVPLSPSVNTKMRWKLEWMFRAAGENLGSWDSSNTAYYTFDGSPIADDFIYIDLMIPAAQVNKADDLLAIKITREASQSDDDCGVYAYLHRQELTYTGKVIFQAD